MEPHQQRVVDEKKANDEKLVKLSQFFATDIFKALPIEEQKRMHEQRGVMRQLSDVLDRRIKAFPKSE